MDRRQVITAVAATGLAASATVARASSGASEAPAEAATVNVTGVALPVIVDGRVKNYVFVALALHLAPGKAAEPVRAQEAYYRDALVRTAHRTSLAVQGDWNRLSEAGISGAMMAIGDVVSGRGTVVRCEIISQAPRRRVGTPSA